MMMANQWTNFILPCWLVTGCLVPPEAGDSDGASDLDGSESAGESDESGESGDTGAADESSSDSESSSESTEGIVDPPEAPLLELSFSPIKQFDFAWSPVTGAEYYQLLESAEQDEPFVQVGGDLVGEATSLTVPLHFRANASYKLAACNAGGCTDSEAVEVIGSLAEAVGYIKASNTDAGDHFGNSVAISADGSTLAIGANWEDSFAEGVDGNQANDSTLYAGAVYVYSREADVWKQQAYVKASNTGGNDQFGWSVALSSDGNTLAVGAPGEYSNALGIDGNQADDSTPNAGAAYVYRREEDVWSLEAYIKASNTDAQDLFGHSMALSSDGNTLAVGAVWEDSNAEGIDGDQTDDSAGNAGAVYVYAREVDVWTQQAYVKASNTDAIDSFGHCVALSSDGSTLAVGAHYEGSNAEGIDGDQANDSAGYSGAVYVYAREADVWMQQAYVKASNTGAGDRFGTSVALSSDGSTLAVGARYEGSNAEGIDHNQADDSALEAGAVYVYGRAAAVWTQQAYVKASNTDADDLFGVSVSLSSDGNTLAVGASGETSDALGIGGSQADDSSVDAGAAYVYVRGRDAWTQHAYVKASNTDASDSFGWSLALSGDGSTLAVGAYQEASSATGIGGDQVDNSAPGAGAVYLY